MDINFNYLRPQKAELLRSRYQIYDNAPSPEIISAGNAVVIPAFTSAAGELATGVVDSDGKFIPQSHTIDDSAEIQLRAKASDIPFVNETIIYLGYLNPHWGHFITDCLSTFWFLGTIDADKYVFSGPLDATPKISPNTRQALTLLGVSDKIEIISQPRRYKKILIPSKGMIPRQYALKESAAVYQTIRRNALKQANPNLLTPKKVLLSRAKLPKALTNEIGLSRIERIFTDNGFTPVYPEQIPLAQLIAILSNAQQVATFSGTPAHNMLFAPDQARLIVIEKYPTINNYQQGIDRLKDLSTTYIDAACLIRSVNPGLGPFIFALTPQLCKFAVDQGFITPDEIITSPRKTLARFFRLYRRHYGRTLQLPQWLEPEISLMTEAYRAEFSRFKPWLSGRRPIFLSDALRPRFILKKIRSLFRS